MDRAPNCFHVEAPRSRLARQDALWDAFLASRTTAIPLPLIDLTLAYTGMLKLQLSLLTTTDTRQNR